MRYGSVCSGIEAASVAWRPLGWTAAWFSEIEPYCCALLKHHYHDVPNLGDMTKITEDQLAKHGPIDVLVGGTPCQSFSLAGLRKGLADARGNLALRFMQLAGVLRPRWLVWENVPGVLSSESGSDFGAILGALAELGYGFAYRILDAQYFGVAQRRRRVFVVGHLGDWRRAAAVLFERDCLQGNPAPSREAGARIAASLTRGTDSSGKGGYAGRRREDDFNIVNARHLVPDVSPALKSRDCKGPSSDGDGDGAPLIPCVTHSLCADGFDASEDGTGHGTPIIPIDMRQASRGATMTNNRRAGTSGGAPGTGIGEPGDPAPSLSDSHPPAVAFNWQAGGSKAMVGGKNNYTDALQSSQIPAVAFADVAQPVRSNPHNNSDGGMEATMHVMSGMAVRRLVPRECEKLQGFEPDYTLISYRGKPAADGPRYRALGNSMAVPVVRWLGERIQLVEGAA